MKVSDRYRRAVVGLGSAALAGTLGLGVHFVAGDPIGLRAGDLAGGDALAAAEVAQPVDEGALEDGTLLNARGLPPEERSSSDPADRRQESASGEDSPSVSGDGQPSAHAGARAVRPADESSAEESDEAVADGTSPAHVPTAQAEEAPAAPSDSSSAPEPEASADLETARVSQPVDVESDGHETEPPEDESEHPPESHEPEDDPSREAE